VGALTEVLDRAVKGGEWRAKSGTLLFGSLRNQGPWFVPGNVFPEAPVNKLLKNNFWSGSHLWEWSASNKTDFLPFFEKPLMLQALSEAVNEILPMNLASLSDKLGHLILQIPVKTISVEYRGTGKWDGFFCDVVWNPNIAPRPLSVVGQRWHDGQLYHCSSGIAVSSETFVPTHDGPGPLNAVIYDPQNDVVLDVTNVNFIALIHTRLGLAEPEHRNFDILRSEKKGWENQIVPITSLQGMVSGNPHRLNHYDDSRKRIYRQGMLELRAKREFVQYRPDDRDGQGVAMSEEARHDRALEDIHFLLEHHGENEVWLWDPYLTASDVLKTLFYNPHSRSLMKAISGAEQIPDQDCEETAHCNNPLSQSSAAAENSSPKGKQIPTKKEQFLLDQRDLLDQHAGNRAGLNLEFRAKVGPTGFQFHDRFIIFPHAEPEPLAWSLGTSVNSAGKKHHILQKVPHGRMIADAFQDLWEELNQPGQLIWKAP
jgi:hypothetical protein